MIGEDASPEEDLLEKAVTIKRSGYFPLGSELKRNWHCKGTNWHYKKTISKTRQCLWIQQNISE